METTFAADTQFMEQTDTLLIIEDDPDIVDLVKINIQDIGLTLDSATNGVDGLEKATESKYSLIILDLMLPELDGMEVCKRIRANDDHTPILMLTAKSEELDKVLGLELGADDYLTKPFSIRELLARIKAILRRVEVDTQVGSGEFETIQFGDLSIDLEKRKVSLAKVTVELTAKEFDLLSLFAKHPGRTYTRQELLDLVWGYQFEGYDHTVNSHINRLRSKIEADPSNPVYLRTVWGVGCRFAEREELE